MLNESQQLLISRIGNKSPLSFITGLKYETNVVKALNNITFLYDPNWVYESMNPTYPIAFFYVKQQTEEMTSEVSQKPMLFYNSEASSNDSVKAGLMNIVADNIIIKPKTYKLDVIIPMNMDTFFSGGYFNVNNMVYANAFMFTSGGTAGKSDFSKSFSEVMNIASNAMGMLKSLITALYGTELSASSIFTMLCKQQDYNKNSIEYMWRNRRILKLKMWNGWKFQYLIIQNFVITKNGENGDFFEGTITCQEMPILTIKPKSESASLSALGEASSILGRGLKKTAETFINAMEATVGGK